ncbi:putative small auxin-up RNA [Rosa chinensis]|uniref:Putative small auxin-up RNA n=1 Tax=Rosa chinensis TaxID=74649 RepID=A0A2P6PQC3_ROSCH|nr:putative small auxin-up RNA [Rosa chinensis]
MTDCLAAQIVSQIQKVIFSSKNQLNLMKTLSAGKSLDVPKSYFSVYVGVNQKKRFVIPIAYLNEPLFLDLLSQAGEEFGYDHPMGGCLAPKPVGVQTVSFERVIAQACQHRGVQSSG